MSKTASLVLISAGDKCPIRLNNLGGSARHRAEGDGPIVQMPTITNKTLCSNVWGAGPAFVVAAPSAGWVKADMVPSPFVLNARGGTVQGQPLTLSGIDPVAVVFADRPTRAAGHVKSKEEWDGGGGWECCVSRG
jgi:hypothetical protein